ncbi:hypothetical protein I317_04357 [Kwoniella heveanensis CBS 569]|nr:hypothetical protein I317_04357 [Kwoniella heveanensis CBS 569]
MIKSEQIRRYIDASLRAYKRPSDAVYFDRFSRYFAEPTVYTQAILDEPDLWHQSVGYRYKDGEMQPQDAHNAFMRAIRSTQESGEADNKKGLLDHVNNEMVRSANPLSAYSDVDSEDELVDMASSILSLGSQRSANSDFEPINDLIPESRRPSLTARRTVSSSSRTRPEFGSLARRVAEDAVTEE